MLEQVFSHDAFIDAEWHTTMPVPVVSHNVRESDLLFRRLARDRVVTEKVVEDIKSRGFVSDRTSVVMRYQQYSTAGGYTVKHALPVAGTESKVDAACVLIEGKRVVNVDVVARKLEDVMLQLLTKLKMKKYCIILLRRRKEVRVVLMAFMGGLSKGKRSSLASVELATMFSSKAFSDSSRIRMLNEQSVGMLRMLLGNDRSDYKVRLPTCLTMARVSLPRIGSVIFATYYTAFVLKGGVYGSRGFLDVVRLSYNGSFFCKETVAVPRLMMCQMNQITPSSYQLIYIGYNIKMRVYKGMLDQEVTAIVNDYSAGKETGRAEISRVQVL